MLSIIISLFISVIGYFLGDYLHDNKHEKASVFCGLIVFVFSSYIIARVSLQIIYILFLIEDALKALTTYLMLGFN